MYWNDCLRLLWPFYLFFMVVRPRVLWTYVQRVYARTSLGGKDVRPEGAWTYVHRTFERAWMGMNETCVKSIDSEQFLNGNEWDRGTCHSYSMAMAQVWQYSVVQVWQYSVVQVWQYPLEQVWQSQWNKCDNGERGTTLVGNVGLHRWAGWQMMEEDSWDNGFRGEMMWKWMFFIVIFDDIGGFEAMFWGFWKHLSALRFYN